jgi:hypothetical protein
MKGRDTDKNTDLGLLMDDALTIYPLVLLRFNSRALAILEKLNTARTSEYVFTGQRPGTPLSGMAMEMILRRMKIDSATVHGFRSSFRD